MRVTRKPASTSRKKQAKSEDFLSALRPSEQGKVLAELLDRHPELRPEASSIAKDLMNDVSVEAIATQVTDLVACIDLEELHGRAGKHAWGYVEPDEAAWEILEESLEEMQNDIKRTMKAGLPVAAQKTCQGIIFGLYETSQMDIEGVLGWVPDFPAESAAEAFSTLLKLHPGSRRRAVGEKIIAEVQDAAPEWIPMFRRLLGHAARNKKQATEKE